MDKKMRYDFGMKKIIRKLFAVDTYFTIAIRRKVGNIVDQLRFHADVTVAASRQDWCADPFLAEDSGCVYLFYEKVHGDMGSIEVVEVTPGCTLSEPTILFEGTHYSYPYVFRKDGRWYMIPESSALKEVALYLAEEFPYRWKKETVLLREAAVDTTVFHRDGQWYLLTFIPAADSECVSPYAYRMNGSELEALRWSEYDSLRVRGAGCPFLYRGMLIRPVQVSTATRYGDKVAFAEMHIDEDSYSEAIIKELTPTSVKAKGQFYDGLHTYNASEHYEVVDIRCGQLDWNKLYKKLRERIRC